MEDYEIIGWPDIQAFMELNGFHQHATLIISHDLLGISSSTYLISKDWLNSLSNETHRK